MGMVEGAGVHYSRGLHLLIRNVNVVGVLLVGADHVVCECDNGLGTSGMVGGAR